MKTTLQKAMAVTETRRRIAAIMPGVRRRRNCAAAQRISPVAPVKGPVSCAARQQLTHSGVLPALFVAIDATSMTSAASDFLRAART
ncbi:MAG: hypothetical protein J0H86_19935 [Xanthomonadaceae bacterium]|nr:hypothetical protein [Xanthomonadaceae bacterium]